MFYTPVCLEYDTAVLPACKKQLQRKSVYGGHMTVNIFNNDSQMLIMEPYRLRKKP
jgi:hypothetical protein